MEGFRPGEQDLVCDFWTEINRNVAARLAAQGWPEVTPEALMGMREIEDYHVMERFRRRIDEIVEFHPLGREQITGIVDIQTHRLLDRAAKERGVTVTLTDEAKELLGDLGYDPAYGARPLKRVVQQKLANPLALGLLDGTFREGDEVEVIARDGALVLTAGEREAVARA